MVEINGDEILSNADWTKRTPDTLADLKKQMAQEPKAEPKPADASDDRDDQDD